MPCKLSEVGVERLTSILTLLMEFHWPPQADHVSWHEDAASVEGQQRIRTIKRGWWEIISPWISIILLVYTGIKDECSNRHCDMDMDVKQHHMYTLPMFVNHGSYMFRSAARGVNLLPDNSWTLLGPSTRSFKWSLWVTWFLMFLICLQSSNIVHVIHVLHPLLPVLRNQARLCSLHSGLNTPSLKEAVDGLVLSFSQ